jgi:Mrr N-terminal domain/Domain of unknown function (DUF3883)
MKRALFPSQARLQQAVLNALATLGGEARLSSLYALVTAYFEGELTSEALTARLKRGDNKWEHRIRWQKPLLLKAGYISDEQRGIWKLTAFGKACLGMGLLDSQDFTAVQPQEGMTLIPSSTQGFMLSSRNRKMIEMYAVDMAIKHFESKGYKVVVHGKPFDLLCKKDNKALYVEVKGTHGAANGIILTRNEVEISQKMSADFVLFVVSEVLVDDDTEVLSGGTVRIVHPWSPKEELLNVIGYTYDLSKHQP